MQEESVRSLKEEIFQGGWAGILPELSMEPAGAGPGAAAVLETAPLPVALGISGGEGEEYALAVRLERETPEALALVDAIIARAKGEVDVQVVGRIEALQGLKEERRPLIPGCSCAHAFAERGTLGCFVRRLAAPDAPLVLSNVHVLVRPETGGPGDAVIQPARLDKGKLPGSLIARLLDFVPLKPEHNLVDAAVAELLEGVAFDASLLTGLGSLAGLRTPPLKTGDSVSKVGRTTALTFGRVKGWDVSNVPVHYGLIERRFDHQFEIESLGTPFSRGGDSGSLIVDGDRRAAGLLFGGNQDGTLSYANPIAAVLGALKLELIV